ncbi:MAG TPA: hypothetical protein ENI97_02140 [Gammaproteobacteria bacterium]|nr:hypothetical protein [Gammaproteobacteria bacterium]
MKRQFLYLLGISIASLILNGCYVNSHAQGTIVIPSESHSHTTIIRRYPTPPHAPAHGYRYYAYDHELQYNSGFGVYVVIDSPDMYFYDDHYIRYYGGHWQIRNRLQDVWRPAGKNDIPHKLRKARRLQRAEHHEHKHHGREERYEERRHYKRDHDNHAEREYGNGHDRHPKHGHHLRHNDHDLRYDSRAGAYVVEKRPGIYFYNNRYLRWNRGIWQSSNKLNGVWRPAKKQQVPGKLLKSTVRKKQKHTRKKQRHEGQQYEEYREHEERQERSHNRLQGIWQGN